MLLAAGMTGGCRHTERERPVPIIIPTVVERSPQFPPIQPVAFEPEQHKLPAADSGTKPREIAKDLVFRGVLEPEAQCLAAKHTSVADMLDREDAPVSTRHGHFAAQATCADDLRRQMRTFTALELRNRSAAEALDRFVQLADVEARVAILRQSMPIMDNLRDLAMKAKAAGVRYPLEPDDADRQRSLTLAQVEQAEAGIRQLNLDLRRRVGLPWVEKERLWPTGDFSVVGEPIDEEMAVQGAIENRPELRGLAALEAGVSVETLPAVRGILRTVSPLLGTEPTAPQSLLHRMLALVCWNRVADEAEVEERRQQIAELRQDRTRAVSDEARAAAMQMNAQRARIALARGRVDNLNTKLEEAKKQRTANIPGADLMEAQARLEWLKARAEVVTEVMAWHQARVKLKAAQGLLAWECAPEGVGR